MTDERLEDLFARLERERLEADRRYNDALTAVDRAIQSVPQLPAAPPAFDDRQVAAINRAWNILPDAAPSIDRSFKGRLRGFIWRLVGPPLEQQKQFNAALVDHINRTADAQRGGQQAVAALLDRLREAFESLAAFESLLVQHLQTITAYVDTKDRSAGGTEIRDRLALVEQRLLAMKRAVEGARPEGPARSGGQLSDGGAAGEPFSGAVESATYVGFEDRFRGAERDIRRRVEEYLPLFEHATDVVDVGCGRGELLDLLRQQGIAARGIDANQAMVEVCRSRGLAVEQADAVGFLQAQRESSIGGLAAIQVVEHFAPAYLLRFLDAAHRAMRPGAPLVLETVNAACWLAFFDTYIRDLTHQRPLHPDTLKYLVEAAGFSAVAVRFRAPVGAGDRLDRVSLSDAATAGHAELAAISAAVNAHADKLNARLFSSMDYAIIARR